MTALQIVVTALGVLGVGGGATAWFLLRPQIAKLQAEAGKVAIEATTLEETADDDHLKTVVDYVVKPLTERVDRLETEVQGLREKVAVVSKRYYALVDWARSVRAWQRGWHPDIEPPLPALPPDVADDL